MRRGDEKRPHVWVRRSADRVADGEPRSLIGLRVRNELAPHRLHLVDVETMEAVVRIHFENFDEANDPAPASSLFGYLAEGARLE
jgi:hypothetical protein